MRAADFLIELVDVDAASFKSWFGNSVIVDDTGQPMVVFRGLGEKQDHTKNKHIIWITPDSNYAGEYATGDEANIMPLYASVRHPFSIGFRSTTTEVKLSDILDRIANAVGKQYSSGEISKSAGVALIDEIRNLEDTDTGEYKAVWKWWTDFVGIKELLQKAGYDAITTKEGRADDVTTYGVFSQSQLKSAISNFDDEDEPVAGDGDWMRAEEFMNEHRMVWKRNPRTGKVTIKWRCEGGARNGRTVPTVAGCSGAPNPAAAQRMKKTRQRTKVRAARKMKKTKRVNPGSRLAAMLNRAGKRK